MSELFKISTITLSTQLPDCQLNLTNIGKYLPIDQDVIGIKYNYADLSVTKGKYSTTVYKKAKIKNADKINKRLFYNQVTIVLNNNGNEVNVKLFGNGSLHITGCKTVQEGTEVTRKIYTKLDAIRHMTDTVVLTKDQNGVLIDKDRLIYSYSDFQIIGHYRAREDACESAYHNVYCINKKEFVIDSKTGMFVSNKMETQRRKFLYNFDGQPIGQSQIVLLKNRNKFYKKNANIYYDLENNLIYHNNNMIIGEIVYQYDQQQVTDTCRINDVNEITYRCNPFIQSDYTLDTHDTHDTRDKISQTIGLNVNCINVYFNIGYTINRQRFYDNLIKYDYICKYKPESYSGIKLLYKINRLNHTEFRKSERFGLCNCTTACTCMNITFLIFQSGNVIATGFRTLQQAETTVKNFNQLCDENRDLIQKRTLF